MPSPSPTTRSNSNSTLETAARLALAKFKERQRVLNAELKILESELNSVFAALKKKKVKKFIDTLKI